MGLISNPGVPEQLIGKSCYKNVQSRGEELWKLRAMLGRRLEGFETDSSSWEKPFSKLEGGLQDPPLLEEKPLSKQEAHLPAVWCEQWAERQLRHEKPIIPTRPPRAKLPQES